MGNAFLLLAWMGAITPSIVVPKCGAKQENTMTQKTEIEIEMSETVAYRRRGDRFETFCPTCKCMSDMATPQVAAVLTRVSEREIYKLVETGSVHFVETDRVLVCLNSLDSPLHWPPTATRE